MGNNYDKKYVEFASNIHFYEFLQDEFKKPHFKVDNYPDEISKLNSTTYWTIETLSNFLRTHPKSFEIF